MCRRFSVYDVYGGDSVLGCGDALFVVVVMVVFIVVVVPVAVALMVVLVLMIVVHVHSGGCGGDIVTMA